MQVEKFINSGFMEKVSRIEGNWNMEKTMLRNHMEIKNSAQ